MGQRFFLMGNIKKPFIPGWPANNTAILPAKHNFHQFSMTSYFTLSMLFDGNLSLQSHCCSLCVGLEILHTKSCAGKCRAKGVAFGHRGYAARWSTSRLLSTFHSKEMEQPREYIELALGPGRLNAIWIISEAFGGKTEFKEHCDGSLYPMW